jgi:hypothetical protein
MCTEVLSHEVLLLSVFKAIIEIDDAYESLHDLWKASPHTNQLLRNDPYTNYFFKIPTDDKVQIGLVVNDTDEARSFAPCSPDEIMQIYLSDSRCSLLMPYEFKPDDVSTDINEPPPLYRAYSFIPIGRVDKENVASEVETEFENMTV